MSSTRPAAKRLDVELRELDARAIEDLQRRPAEDRDHEFTVQPGTEVWANGKLAAGFYELEESTADLLAYCKKLPFVRDYRTSGMRSHSVIFGYRPREPLRKDYCAISALANTAPHAFAELDRWAAVVERYYAEARPDVYRQHREWAIHNVKEEWRMTNSIFTSGIVNKNAAHHYHKDFGNLTNSWNAMIVLSHDIDGGETVVPALRTAFQYDGRPAVLIFSAESSWHAVKPTHVRGTRGFRYSIVFYTLALMCHCLSRKGELDRIRQIRTDREVRRGNLDELVGALEAKGAARSRGVIARMREQGKLDALKQEMSLDERIERLKHSKSSRAKQVLQRLERQRAEQKAQDDE